MISGGSHCYWIRLKTMLAKSPFAVDAFVEALVLGGFRDRFSTLPRNAQIARDSTHVRDLLLTEDHFA
jgi:hypothetical protein